MQAWGPTAALVVTAMFATWADARQARRRDLDRPGWIPWQLITVLAGIGALAAAVAAFKA